MQPAHAVSFLACVECEHTHRETFVGIGIFATHVHQVIPRNTELGRIFTHIFAEKTLVKIVMTGRHGGMHGVKAGCPYKFKSHVEIKMLFLDIIHQALQIEQCGVPFVAMVEF